MTLVRQASRSAGGYGLGVVLIVLSGVTLSSGGFLIRSIEEASGWQILFYRGLGFTVISFLFTVIYNKGQVLAPLRAIGLPGIIGASALGIGFGVYLFAVLLTTVANVVFILSIGPFAAAILGWLILGERVARFTWLAMALAVLGVALMVASGMEEGGLLGIGIALLAPISFAIMIVAIRKRTDRDMTPMLPLAGLISMAVGFAFSDTLVISTSDLAYALFLGVAQIGISFILITLGSRLVPSAQVPLLALSETVLAPIWVWMAFNEQPAKFALLGGLVVLVAVVAEAIAGIRREANRVKSS